MGHVHRPQHDNNQASILFLKGLILGKPIEFIIDSGAERSIINKCHVPQTLCYPTATKLQSVDGSPVENYGHFNGIISVSQLRRDYKVNFVVTGTVSILGADFLTAYGLSLDMRHQKLSDPLTNRSATLLSKSSPSTTIRVTECEPADYLVSKFPSLVKAPDYSFLPCRMVTEHSIETNGPPIYSKPRPLPPDKFEIARKEFDLLLEMKIVRPSNSPWSSPLHMVRKADGTWRPCGDYRRLNAMTIPDRYSLPNINHIHHKMTGCTVFSKLDLVKAYHFIPIREADIPKTTICTPFGNFEYLRMPFGLRNAASTFQRYVDSLFRDMDFVVCYLDDIIIFSDSNDKHLHHVSAVCKRLEEEGLRVNNRKSVLVADEVSFLGYHVSSAGIKPLPDRVAALQQLSPPTDNKTLQRYLGMFGFYQKCIPHFSETVLSLRDLVTSKEFTWTTVHLEAFEALKQAVCDAAVLAFPVPKAPLTITADASSYAIGAALHQTVNGQSRPLSFFSRKLTDVESRYSTFDRELLAVFAAIRKWKYLVSGSEVTVFTDHKPLVGALSNPKERDSERQQRQISFILEYVSDIVHIAGKTNVVADVLSRPIAKVNALQRDQPEESLDLIQIAKEQRNCSNLSESYKVFKIGQHDLFCEISTPNPRPFIPESLRRLVFRQLHELSHPGWKASCRLIGSRYFWPSLKADVKVWATECEACQCSKVTKHVKRPLTELPCPSQRFTTVHIDIVGPLESIGTPYNSMRYLVTMIDSHTRWLEAVPVAEITTEVVCRAFMYHWVARFGPPLYVISDKGSQFRSELIANLNELLGVHHIRTSAYNPKANGMIERAHRSLKAALMARGGKWIDELPTVLLGIRSYPDENGSSAYSKVYGEQPLMPHIVLTDNAELSKSLGKLVFPYNIPRSRRMASQIPKELTTCKYVWVRLDRVRKSLEAPYQGPYEVVNRTDLMFTVRMRAKEVNVSIERLKPAKIPDSTESEQCQGQTVATDTDAETKVDAHDATLQSTTTRIGRHVKFKKDDDYLFY